MAEWCLPVKNADGRIPAVSSGEALAPEPKGASLMMLRTSQHIPYGGAFKTTRMSINLEMAE